MVEITRLFWKKAFTSDAFLLGEVESAEVDMNTWQITNFYVGLTDEATKNAGVQEALSWQSARLLASFHH